MSLKSARWKFFNGFSLKTRLTWSIALSMGVLFVVICAVAYFALDEILDKTSHDFMLDEVSTISDILHHHPNDFYTLRKEVLWYPNMEKVRKERSYFYYVRVLDSKYKEIIATQDMDKHIKISAFPKASDFQDLPAHFKRWKTDMGEIYYLLNAKVQIDSESSSTRYIQIALDVSFQDEILHGYLQKLLEMTIVTIGVAALLGGLLAARGLRGVKRLTQAMENITTMQLHQRIEIEKLPKELASLARSYNKMLERLEKSFVRISSFSANVAHEIRTPFNNLMGEAEIILSKARSADEYREVIESSIEEYQRLLRMIDSIMFLAKAESSQVLLNQKEISVRNEIEKLCEFNEPVALEKNISLTVSGTAKLVADVSLFQQAVNNLITNALRYTQLNGLVHISIEEFHSESICIRVKDSGIGIAAEHLPCIFDRFYRVDPARSKKEGGLGLGLSIVHSIMELHQGKVEIDSVLGEGTDVRLLFPL